VVPLESRGYYARAVPRARHRHHSNRRLW